MKRVALLTALLVLGTFATPATAAASSCSVASIAKPNLPGLIGVNDRMVGNCTSQYPGGYNLVLNLQYEENGTWHYDNPTVTAGPFNPGQYGALENVWSDITPNCGYNWRGYGQWQDAIGDIIVSKYSLTLAKTC